MVKLDSLNLGALVRELDTLLAQAAPQKISQLTDEDYLFVLRRPGQTLRLLICLRAEESRLHLIPGGTPPARIPSGFTMLLRKHLEGRRLGSVRQVGLERRVELHFPAYLEKPELWLIVDIGARESNLVLQDASRRVLGAHRKPVVFSEPPDRPRADQVSAAELAAFAGQKLEQVVFGLSPFYARRLSVENWDAFWDDYRAGRFQPAVSAEGQLNFLGEGRRFGSMQEAAVAAWSGSSQAPGLEQQRAALLRRVQKSLAKVERRLAELSRDLAETEKAEQYQHWGQLLLARLDQVPARSSGVSLLDFDETRPVEVPLDARLTPSQNAQKLFRRYRKLLRARPLIAEQVRKAEAERDYFVELRLAIEGAGSPQELLELEPRKPAIKKKPPPERPLVGLRRYQLGDFELWVGRNPSQNDRLTHKMAAREDLWFHARNIPGAHVILRTAGRAVSQEAVLAAAVLAARHSKAADSSKVEVDFTLVRHVKKPAGSPPGKAIYRHESSLVVDPCQPLPDLVELRKNSG